MPANLGNSAVATGLKNISFHSNHKERQCQECSAAATAAKSLQLCPTPSDPMDCSLPGSSVHGIFQARVLEWVAITFSKRTLRLPQIALISHANKVMLKILQDRLQQYVNHELPDVQAGFRKGRGTRYQIVNICWIIEKAREFQKNI